jgi:hypothetical protein
MYSFLHYHSADHPPSGSIHYQIRPAFEEYRGLTNLERLYRV